MNKLKFFATALVLVLATTANAQNSKVPQAAVPETPTTVQWKSKLTFDEKRSSKDKCLGRMKTVVYTFVLVGDQLTIDTGGGTQTKTTVNLDGPVDHTFYTNKGNRPHIYGNVRTRSFKVVMYDGTCVWDAQPSM